MTRAEDPLEGFPIVVAFPVHWGEMDALRHVNNVSYFRYFETARIAYFEALGEALRGGVGPILAETSCRFRVPLSFPDDLRVGARVTGWYDFGFVHEYVIVSTKAKGVAASGGGRIVTYDYARAAKVPLPDDLRRALEALERRELPRLAS